MLLVSYRFQIGFTHDGEFTPSKHYSQNRASHYRDAEIIIHNAQFDDSGNYSVQVQVDKMVYTRNVSIIITGMKSFTDLTIVEIVVCKFKWYMYKMSLSS